MSAKISAVVFDMDGVIFDTERLSLECWKLLADREGLEGIEEVCKRCIGRTTPESIVILREAYGEGLDVAGLRAELSALMHKTIAERGMPIKTGVREILDFLKDSGVPIALASSTRYVTVTSQLGEAGFLDYFSVVVGGDMAEHGKPAPDIYLAACEKLGADPAKAIAVEDSYNGIRAAHAAGMKPVMVPDILPPDDEMREKAVHICRDLHEAREVIAEMLAQ